MIEVKTKTMKDLLKPHLPVTEYGLFVEMCKELEALREVEKAARELLRSNDLLDRESVLMKDVDAIRSTIEKLDEAR